MDDNYEKTDIVGKPPGLRVSKPSETAAGLKAVLSTTTAVLSKMGVVRGMRGILNLNQAGGIDCQSCAWPDPESHRTIAEFCENGAKALADEATTKHIGAEFFAKYSLAELAAQEDFWLNDQGRLTEPVVVREGSDHFAPISWEEAFEIIATNLNSLASPDEAVSTHRAGRLTRQLFSINFSFANSAQTICRTVQTCVTNRPASHWLNPSGWVKLRSVWTISKRPISSWW